MKRRSVLVMHHPDDSHGPFSAHLGSAGGDVTWQYGNTEAEAIENLRLRLAADRASVYPKRVKVEL